MLPKRPDFPADPTVSFIRPPPKPVHPKSDPVRLYQFYKDQWKKNPIPGIIKCVEWNYVKGLTQMWPDFLCWAEKVPQKLER